MERRTDSINTHLQRKMFLFEKKGQIILEILWLILFSCAFLSVLSYLYDRGQMEIRLSRVIKYPNEKLKSRK